jgi:hypothetical protein
MMPSEASKESKKPKHDLERIADSMETESAEPSMPDFMKDADTLLALEAKRDKMIDQKTELSSASNVLELKPGTAGGAIDKEIDALQDKVNEVLGKYGKEANAFQVDAYRVGELKDDVADAEAMLRGLEADYKKETNRDAKAKLERQIEDATAAWQEARNELSGMKDKYVAKEAAAKAELAGATDADVEAALSPLDEQIEMKRETDDAIKMAIEASAESLKEKAEMAKETDDAIKMTMEASAEALREEELTPEVTSREATAAETKEVMDAVTDEYLESEEFGKGIDAANEKLKQSQEAKKAARANGMAERVADRMALDEESEKALAEFRANLEKKGAEAKFPEKDRDTLVDEVMDVRDDELLPDVADNTAEQAFFAKGEVMDQAHTAGKSLEYRNKAERRGDAGAERHEMAQEAEALRAEIPAMEQQFARAEQHLDQMLAGRTLSAEEQRMLGDEKVITPGKRVDAFMGARSKGGFAEKAKSFFGGLFSKKTRELNHAIELYASVRDQFNEKQSRLNELDNRLNSPEAVRQAMQLKAERKDNR